MDGSIKNLVDDLFDIAVLAVKSKNSDEEEKKVRQTARKEILSFLMYLSASDGSIEVKEAIFLKDYFMEQISPEEICQRIEEDNIYSSSFEQKIPSVLKRLVKVDNANFERNGLIEESVAEKYICTYEAIGKEFIACDHDVSQSEKEDLNTYITNMRSYYRANYRGSDEATKAAHFEHTVDQSSSRNQKYMNQRCATEEQEESLEELMRQLNALIGLERVKITVNQLIHFNTIRQIRKERCLGQMPMTQHMVFYGNPGTGKTTVARLIAQIYHHLGLLSKGHMVEVDRSGLVAGYVGHTALKVKEVVKQAKGGVLFIDEAYALTYRRSENDFGWEAVDTLIKAMEDEREDLVVIIAGYTEPMTQFISSNPGLKSRFNRFIYFDDYTGEQLFDIYKKMSSEAGYGCTEDAEAFIKDFFENKVMSKGAHTAIGFNSSVQKKRVLQENENFANARLVRNFLETAIMNQADRLYLEGEFSNEQLCKIEYEDVVDIV
jgi:SpoVK/Ycf46/Vps4 family AAA+-type ATPase